MTAFLTSPWFLLWAAAASFGVLALAYAFTEGVWRLVFGATAATVSFLIEVDRATAFSLARAGQRALDARQRRALAAASDRREAIPMGSGDRR